MEFLRSPWVGNNSSKDGAEEECNLERHLYISTLKHHIRCCRCRSVGTSRSSRAAGFDQCGHSMRMRRTGKNLKPRSKTLPGLTSYRCKLLTERLHRRPFSAEVSTWQPCIGIVLNQADFRVPAVGPSPGYPAPRVMSRTRTVAIRIATDDVARARQNLESLGAVGDAVLRKVADAGQRRPVPLPA
jgi:hypothetical protein